MTISRFEFPKQLYVGVEKRASFDTVKSPLSFAVPFGTNAAFKKRKETVDRWVEGYSYYSSKQPSYQGVVIDNSPLEGFAVGKSVSRYSTSNKWFEISDPRGFTLQITAANIADIMLNGKIDNGKIEGKYLWARDGAVNYLCSVNDKEYLKSLQTKTVTVPGIGDLVQTKTKRGVFAGQVYVLTFEIKDNRYDYRLQRTPPPSVKINKRKEPYIVLQEKLQDYMDKYSEERVIQQTHEYLASWGKEHDIISKGNDVRKFPYGKAMLMGWNTFPSVRQGSMYLFKTKKELDDFQLDYEQAKRDYEDLHYGQQHVKEWMAKNPNDRRSDLVWPLGLTT